MIRHTEIDLKDYLKQKKKIPMLKQGIAYVSANEYAIMVNSHPITINRWLNAGKIEGALKIGGRWKIPIMKEA